MRRLITAPTAPGAPPRSRVGSSTSSAGKQWTSMLRRPPWTCCSGRGS
jgi:hypothetical protein